MSRLIPSVNDLQTWCQQNNRLDILQEWDYVRNSPLTPSDVSRSSNKPVYWICKNCGNSRQRSVGSVTHAKQAIGCKLCTKNKPPVKKVKYTSDVVQKLIDQSGANAILLSPYIDSKTKITCQCRKCGHVWDVLPGNVISGHGCSICGREKTGKARRGNISDVQDVIESHGLNIVVSGIYETQESTLTCMCRKCNSQWDSMAKTLMYKIRKGINPCKVCSKQAIREQAAFRFYEKVKEINPDVRVLTPYVRTDEHVQCECLICGHVYPVLPLNLLKGRRCPQCALQKSSERLRDTHETFLEKLTKVNTDIIVIGRYVNQNTRVECICKKCGNNWFPVPYHLLSGVGCPECLQSHGEQAIKTYLEQNNILYETQKRFPDCRYRHTLAFDFYLPQINMCIEYDGIQHFEAKDVFGGDEGFEETKIRDRIKNEYCQQKGIILMRIPYYEDKITNELDSAIKEASK